MGAIERYLSFGWTTVQLHYMRDDGHCSCGRGVRDPEHDYRQGGKHPVVEEWQHGAPDIDHWAGALAVAPFNIGVVTGVPSGHWVLDYDPANAGDGAAAMVARLLGENRLAPHVKTGGGGVHWRFEMPLDFEPTNRRGAVPPGIDVRGTGGQVVAAPSVSGKGAYVEIAPEPAPHVAPEWLLDMIRPAPPTTRTAPAGWSPLFVPDAAQASGSGDRVRRYMTGALSELLGELGNAVEGTRNTVAFRVACRLVEMVNAGWIVEDDDAGSAYHLFHDACQGCALPAHETLAVWHSARRTIGERPAVLPPEWTDPLWIDALPPLPPSGSPPFALPPGDVGRPEAGDPVMTAPAVGVATTDPWELAIGREVSRQLVREEARRRVAELAAGDRASIKSRLRGELLTTKQLRTRPRLRPLVDGILYANTLARIVGESGSGKSFAVIDLVARLAAGMPWAGRATTATPVANVVAEGDEGVSGRTDAWEAHHGCEIDGVTWLPRAIQIGGAEWPAWCELMAEDGYGCIVIDTQARATVGRDEINGQDMGLVVDALDDLRKATGALVLLVHHTPKGGLAGRGHGAVRGALQTELLVRKNGRAISVGGPGTGKSKDGEELGEVVFDLTDVMVSPEAGPYDPVMGPTMLGVVPIWRGDPAVREAAVSDERPVETARQARARMLWRVMRDRANRGDGATRADMRVAFGDDRSLTSVKPDSVRKYFSDAWNDLMQLGLIAQKWGAARYVVVVRADQAAEGFLTDNTGETAQVAPDGYDIVSPAEKAD